MSDLPPKPAKKKAMASAKTLRDFLQPAKRIKVSSSVEPSNPLNHQFNPIPSKSITDSSSSALTAVQRSRIEFNKLRAKAKRNLNLCLQLVSKSKSEGVGYVKLEKLLVEETWLEALSGELQKPYAKTLCKFLENEICNGSVPIYPPQHLIFNALNSTPFDGVKAVIIGQDPYHGPGQAMGLSFSVPEGIKPPSSLVNIFKELKQDLGFAIPSHGNLERWAIQSEVVACGVVYAAVRRFQVPLPENPPWWKAFDVDKPGSDEVCRILAHLYSLPKAKYISVGKDGDFSFSSKSSDSQLQPVPKGVLLLNTVLTVRSHQANSHAKKGWEQFTDSVIKTISQNKEGVVFLLWGNSAQEKSRLIDGTKHYILKAAHPSGLSANRGYFGCRHFSQTNKLLEKMGNLPIDWQLTSLDN